MLFNILDVPTSVVVVVTLLVGIMKEQVSEFGMKQIHAVYVTSNITLKVIFSTVNLASCTSSQSYCSGRPSGDVEIRCI